jgi:ribosomal protein S17
MKPSFILGRLTLLLTLTLAPAHAAASAQPPAAASAGTLTGKVAETMNAASYTYVLIDTGAKKAWAAAPQFAVKVGDTVAIADAMPMKNYQSKTLNRTFDVVYFTGNISVNGAPAAPSTNAPSTKAEIPAPWAAAMPPGHPTMPAKTGPDLTGIKRAENGQTVAEVIAGKTKFAGRPIAIRARVVKYNAQILGKNWLHIQDGSGSPGANDLTVTTTATAKVGDLVLVTGKLGTDRDFGSGYKYPLIIEDATVVTQ